MRPGGHLEIPFPRQQQLLRLISVVIPTVTGRERWLEQCLDAYTKTSVETRLETIIIKDRDTCGIAWQDGADASSGDYIHFTADDLTPHPGWHQAAVGVVEQGALPCPLILGPHGTLESCGTWGQLDPDGSPAELARVPFMSRAQWDKIGPMEPWHYYTDNLISWKGYRVGIPTVVSHGYKFTHHWAQEKRKTNDQLQADWLRFEAYKDQ